MGARLQDSAPGRGDAELGSPAADPPVREGEAAAAPRRPGTAARFAHDRSRSTRFSTFPVGLRGISSRNSTWRGIL